MKSRNISILLAILVIVCSSCTNPEEKLKGQMKPLAKEYLKNDKITDYKHLTIVCVDTLTELGYAKLNTELLAGMQYSYEQQYQDALNSGDTRVSNAIERYLNEIIRMNNDFEDLMDNGQLKSDGVLLFMVTAKYLKDNKSEEFMFMVNADKKSLHTIDPFGDNLLYKDVQK